MHPYTPILIFGGHTHIRDCSKREDARSTAYLNSLQISLMVVPCHWRVDVTWKQWVSHLRSSLRHKLTLIQAGCVRIGS